MAQYSHTHGGVGAPVGLTVFKTAGGSLGAVPGGFDSHTPLPQRDYVCVVPCLFTHRFCRICNTMLPIPVCKTMLPILCKEKMPFAIIKFSRLFIDKWRRNERSRLNATSGGCSSNWKIPHLFLTFASLENCSVESR